MKRKKILIDLSILRSLHCGLGQIAYNYGKYYKEHYSDSTEFELYLLVPKQMKGHFGLDVKYITIRWWHKYFSFFMPKFDLWHAIHQLSHYRSSRKDMKYLLTVHDLNFMYEKKGAKQKRILAQLQNEVDRADKIVCISEFARSEVRKYLKVGDKSIKVIYNGVEQFDISCSRRPDFVKDNKPFLFTIGQVKRKKNFHVLLPLMQLFPEKELYIAGQNGTGYANEIRSQIDALGLKNVHLVGGISHEERVWMYQHCEAFLFPSLFEGFGLPIIEAMSQGKPVFSSRETSLNEIGGDCAFFWDNFDPHHMKEVIDQGLSAFASEPGLSQKSIEYARTYSYEHHMELYWKIYQKLLS